MRIKIDFVTNSSSTAFVIVNTSSEKKSLVDFVKENPELIQDFVDTYGFENQPEYCQEGLILSAEYNNEHFDPGERKICVFGDEQGTLIGNVFDYVLRDGGSSKSFSWHFHEYYR